MKRTESGSLIYTEFEDANRNSVLTPAQARRVAKALLRFAEGEG